MEERHAYTNRLIHETSPYLLQHAHNPVDWYPWGEEALTRARKENKPILLSIGYSSCHWCHVMEKESFENEEIAKIMNQRFINIKVDREERPDLDEVYMNAVQVMTGSGGWPLNLFLTPDLVPYHGGTYFPPEERGGMPGFAKVLVIVSDYYHTHRDEIEKLKAQVKEALHQIIEIVPSEEKGPGEEILSKAFDSFEKEFDPDHGGFGRAPKFPSSMTVSFLLRYWKRAGSAEALSMVELTLEKMADGGIYDHLGGGFHRYSVDGRWLIPHFEKMLYDNALLSKIYFETFLATRKEKYRRVAEEVLNYVRREMTHPEGGFFSTQDADTEGEEGKFYVWSREEIKGILGKERGVPFCAYFGVTPQGNFEGGRNVLHVASTLEKVSEQHGIALPDLGKVLEEGEKKLFAEREKRTRPGRDEKILTCWNGLMVSGFVSGFKATGNEDYLKQAKRSVLFILDRMKKNGRLMRVSKGDRSHTFGYSEDYAFFIQALLDLYEATFETDFLREAESLNQRMIDEFWDNEKGGFFFTGKEDPSLIARTKSPYDNAVPSSNSISVFNLVRLGTLIGDESLKEKADRILRLFSDLISKHPSGFAQMLSGLSFFIEPEEVGVVGSKHDPVTLSLVHEIYRTYLPNSILSLRDPQEPLGGDWLPSLKEREEMGFPAVFVCRKSTCLPPAKTAEELARLLG